MWEWSNSRGMWITSGISPGTDVFHEKHMVYPKDTLWDRPYVRILPSAYEDMPNHKIQYCLWTWFSKEYFPLKNGLTPGSNEHALNCGKMCWYWASWGRLHRQNRRHNVFKQGTTIFGILSVIRPRSRTSRTDFFEGTWCSFWSKALHLLYYPFISTWTFEKKKKKTLLW